MSLASRVLLLVFVQLCDYFSARTGHYTGNVYEKVRSICGTAIRHQIAIWNSTRARQPQPPVTGPDQLDTRNVLPRRPTYLYIYIKRRKSKKNNQLALKSPKFSAQLPSSGGYFLQLTIPKIQVTEFMLASELSPTAYPHPLPFIYISRIKIRI